MNTDVLGEIPGCKCSTGIKKLDESIEVVPWRPSDGEWGKGLKVNTAYRMALTFLQNVCDVVPAGQKALC